MQGGELPLPTNAKENAELAKIVAAQKLAGSKLGALMYHNLATFWLRTDDVDNEGTFVDSRTKVKIGFTKWHPGSPNNWKNPAYGYKIDQDFVVSTQMENGTIWTRKIRPILFVKRKSLQQPL